MVVGSEVTTNGGVGGCWRYTLLEEKNFRGKSNNLKLNILNYLGKI
jgi:hypothetical protein